MVRTRYIGSTRAKEAGFSATHKQDFQAHITGGDWIHLASHISVLGGYEHLQAELDSIESSISILPNAVLNMGTSINNSVALFSGTTGKVIQQSSILIDPIFGDITFPTNGSYNVISVANIDSAFQAQSFQIFAQSNIGGQGGNLDLGTGYNFLTNSFDGMINLYSSKLSFFRNQVNPTITQEDSFGVPNDLFIISQGTTTANAPSSLWLESGVNSLGQGGNVYLYSWPGVVDIQSQALQFDKNYPAAIYHEDRDVLTAQNMYITAQSIPLGAVNAGGIPGNLWLQSGYNPNTDVSGDLYLYTDKGKINILTSTVEFAAGYTNPIITQSTALGVPGQNLNIKAQNSDSLTGGNLELSSGTGVWNGFVFLDGNIVLNTNSGNVVLNTSNVLFGDSITQATISQPDVDGIGSPLTLFAQTSNHNKGGDINIYSGYGYLLDPPAIPGDDGNINIIAGNGPAFGGTGGINLVGSVFFQNTADPGIPTNGVFLWSNNGRLLCKGPDGVTYQLNWPPVTYV
jgi:hypothetical protein